MLVNFTFFNILLFIVTLSIFKFKMFYIYIRLEMTKMTMILLLKESVFKKQQQTKMMILVKFVDLWLYHQNVLTRLLKVMLIFVFFFLSSMNCILLYKTDFSIILCWNNFKQFFHIKNIICFVFNYYPIIIVIFI